MLSIELLLFSNYKNTIYRKQDTDPVLFFNSIYFYFLELLTITVSANPATPAATPTTPAPTF